MKGAVVIIVKQMLVGFLGVTWQAEGAPPWNDKWQRKQRQWHRFL